MDDFNIIISGGFAGIAQTLTGHPFDTVKVRYINSNRSTLLSCVRSISSESYGNFYRGVSSPMIGSLIMNVQTFYMYSWFNNIYEHPLVSGALTGFGLSFVESPTDLIKSRMQVNPYLTYQETIKEVGIFGIYKGLNITMMRNTVSVGLYFWGYEYTKSLFRNDYMGAFVGGSVSGVCCWGVNYPMDNIKTRIQTDTEGKYKGIIDCVRKTPTKNLWSGFTPCIIRSIVVNPFVFLAYEIGIRYLQ